MLLRVLDKLRRIFGFLVGVLWVAAVPSLFLGFYSYLMLYFIVFAASWGWGVFVWAVPVVMLSPVVVAWFWVLRKRYREYMAVLTGATSVVWDVEKAIEGWVRMTRPEKKQEKRN